MDAIKEIRQVGVNPTNAGGVGHNVGAAEGVGIDQGLVYAHKGLVTTGSYPCGSAAMFGT